MATIPVGYGQASIIWTNLGRLEESIVTIGYDPPDPLNPAANASTIRALVSNASGPCTAAKMTNQWRFEGVKCVEMDDTGPLTGESRVPVTGSNTGGSLPLNCAILIQKQTASGGRRGRGRMFLPPFWPLETDVNDAGGITPALVTSIGASWDFVRTGMVTASLPPRLFHATSPFTPTIITGFTVSTLIATQRRRLRR